MRRHIHRYDREIKTQENGMAPIRNRKTPALSTTWPLKELTQDTIRLKQHIAFRLGHPRQTHSD